jgi:hypothetical protein
MSASILPAMLEIPSILKPRLRLLGVNATLKRVAEKLELDMHGLSDLDSMMRSAETTGAAMAASHNSDLDSENFMAGGVVVVY